MTNVAARKEILHQVNLCKWAELSTD